MQNNTAGKIKKSRCKHVCKLREVQFIILSHLQSIFSLLLLYVKCLVSNWTFTVPQQSDKSETWLTIIIVTQHNITKKTWKIHIRRHNLTPAWLWPCVYTDVSSCYDRGEQLIMYIQVQHKEANKHICRHAGIVILFRIYYSKTIKKHVIRSWTP